MVVVRSLLTFVHPLALAAALLSLPLPAQATFSGDNGAIAYADVVDANTPASRAAIFVSGLGQLTFPAAGPPVSFDSNPAWSPDGTRLAYARDNQSASQSELHVINADGSGDRILATSGVNFGQIALPAWSPDGKTIVYNQIQFGGYSLFTVTSNGGAPASLYAGVPQPSSPTYSSQGDLAFNCQFRSVSLGPLTDICVLSNGQLQELPLALYPILGVGPPSWSSDGKQIYFVANDGIQPSTVSAIASGADIFRVNKDGTGLVRVTTPVPVPCPYTPPPFNSALVYRTAVPSPDGKVILSAIVREYVGNIYIDSYTGQPNGCAYYLNGEVGLWSMNADGSNAALLIPGFFIHPTFDWQPIRSRVKLQILDGHGNPLKGLKLELLTSSDVLVDDRPLNTTGGTYLFQTPVAPGNYVLRATLTDRCLSSACTPSFDVVYAPSAPDAVQIYWNITVDPSRTGPIVLNFSQDDPAFRGDNIANSAALDSMANIYFRVRQYVDWVHANLTPSNAPTVHFYTFDVTDPVTGNPVAPMGAYYKPLNAIIVFGSTFSEYQERDGLPDPGHDDGAPVNGEWHEFTHHLFNTFVHGPGCPGDINHAGYNNPDTCDSMDEGFAAFLPTLASQEVLGTSSAMYDSLWDLSAPTKPWQTRVGSSGTRGNAEDLAAAALFWDLVRGFGKTEASQIIGADGKLHNVTYSVETATPLTTLWQQMTSNHTGTVFDLRGTFPPPYYGVTIDLDGDGYPDVLPIDFPFLIHGFYPIDGQQSATAAQTTYYYDVGYAQRADPTAPRDAAVGSTSHRVYDASGNLTATLVPRHQYAPAASANLSITTLDANGAALPGASLNVTLSYPNGQQTQAGRLLNGGSGDLVHLELLPYFDYLLPDGSPLPACDPTHDVQVTVTMTASIGTQSSTTSSALDNCTYLKAVDAATGPSPLSYTFTVPVTRQTIGGTVFGLTDTLVLTDNGTDPLSISSNGAFTFATPVASTVPYNVAIASQPNGQLCTVSNGSGTMGSANVSDVQVTCVAIQQDVTNLLTMSSSGFVLNRTTQTFNFRVTLANNSTTTFAGPLWLLVSGLPSSASVANAAGYSIGTPYVLASLAGNQLAPGNSVAQTVAVSDPGLVSLHPVVSVLAVEVH